MSSPISSQFYGIPTGSEWPDRVGTGCLWPRGAPPNAHRLVAVIARITRSTITEPIWITADHHTPPQPVTAANRAEWLRYWARDRDVFSFPAKRTRRHKPIHRPVPH